VEPLCNWGQNLTNTQNNVARQRKQKRSTPNRTMRSKPTSVLRLRLCRGRPPLTPCCPTTMAHKVLTPWSPRQLKPPTARIGTKAARRSPHLKLPKSQVVAARALCDPQLLLAAAVTTSFSRSPATTLPQGSCL
jgi:hypothetical protein